MAGVAGMRRDPLFRGCTRPPMFMGVPYVPFAIGAAACILPAFYVDMFCLALLPVVIVVMRQMARRDDMVFRLLGLRLRFLLKAANRRLHAGMWVFSPNAYRSRLHGVGRARP